MQQVYRTAKYPALQSATAMRVVSKGTYRPGSAEWREKHKLTQLVAEIDIMGNGRRCLRPMSRAPQAEADTQAQKPKQQKSSHVTHQGAKSNTDSKKNTPNDQHSNINSTGQDGRPDDEGSSSYNVHWLQVTHMTSVNLHYSQYCAGTIQTHTSIWCANCKLRRERDEAGKGDTYKDFKQ